MGFSLGGSKQKTSQTQNQSMNQTSTFNPNAQFLGMVQGGLDRITGAGDYGRTTGADVAGYLNPMQDQLRAGLVQQAAVAANANDAQAAAAGAFGGTGWGLLRGETNRAFADAAAQQEAQNYNAALAAAMAERQNAANYGLQQGSAYLSGLGLLGNWGTTNTAGTSSGTSQGKSSGFNWGLAGYL